MWGFLLFWSAEPCKDVDNFLWVPSRDPSTFAGRSSLLQERSSLLDVVFAPTVTTPEQYVEDLEKAGFVDIQAPEKLERHPEVGRGGGRS